MMHVQARECEAVRCHLSSVTHQVITDGGIPGVVFTEHTGDKCIQIIRGHAERQPAVVFGISSPSIAFPKQFELCRLPCLQPLHTALDDIRQDWYIVLSGHSQSMHDLSCGVG